MSQWCLSPLVSSLNNWEEDFLGAGRALAGFTAYSQSKRATKLRHSPIAATCGGFPEIIGTDGVLAVATGFELLTGLSQQPSDAVIGLPVVSSLSPVHQFCLHYLERLETKTARCPSATLNLGCFL